MTNDSKRTDRIRLGLTDRSGHALSPDAAADVLQKVFAGNADATEYRVAFSAIPDGKSNK